MASGAQLSVPEGRRSARHPVSYRVIGEHRRLGDVSVLITNISAHGFMIEAPIELGRGERLTVRLPVIGRIEAHMIWNTGDRAGFQFERIVRHEEFTMMIESIQPNARLRRAR